MESIWNTVATILATAIVIYGGYFLRDFLQGKRETKRQKLERERETRDARRKYRGSIVMPVREALVTLGSNLQWESHLDIIRKVEERGKIKADVAELKKVIESITKKDSARISTEILPKVATITNQDTKEFLESIFREVFFLNNADILPKEVNFLDEVGITVEKLKEKLNLAYQKLEDYVALAD